MDATKSAVDRRAFFPPELRTASIVPRWSIVRTLNQDVITNHSYYVIFYGHQIARLINWKGPYHYLMFSCTIHDLEETITGDIVSPVKAEIIDDTRADEYISIKMGERFPDIVSTMQAYEDDYADWIDDIFKIQKAADRLDALLFLITEKRLGNTIIAPLIDNSKKMLQAAWNELPCSQSLRDELYATVVLGVLRNHEVTGGHGV